jgi:hypothetical protein
MIRCFVMNVSDIRYLHKVKWIGINSGWGRVRKTHINREGNIVETELINDWATQIAEASVPDEAELAPSMLQAYLNGGKDRDGLFRQARRDIVGGFGIGDLQAIFPWILNGIAVAAPLINAAFAAGVVDKYLSALKDLLAIRDSLARKKQVEALPDAAYLDFKKIMTVLPKELAKANLSPEQCELITFHVLQEIYKDPASVKHVQKLAKGKK